MPVKEQTTSDNVNFVCKAICEIIPGLETNEKNTLIKNLPEILKAAQKKKQWCYYFMTGEIEIFDEDTEEETEEETEEIKTRQGTFANPQAKK